MAIDTRLQAGLEAYLRGDLVSATTAWEDVKTQLSPEEEDGLALIDALTYLTRGLLAAQSEASSQPLFDQCRDRLADLPNRVLGVDIVVLRAGCDHQLDRLLATPPPVLVARRYPPGTGRFLLFVALLIAAALVLRFTPLNHYLDREVAVEMLVAIRGSIWAPIVLLAAFVVLAPLGAPLSPMILAGGAVFGFGKGIVLNHIGALLGGSLGFQLARLLGRDFVAGIAGGKLRRVEAAISRHGFWSLAGLRLMPIPYPLANFGLALAGVSFPLFLLSTALGLIPGIAMYTYLATLLTSAAEGTGQGKTLEIVIALICFAVVGLSPTLWQQRKRKLRYRTLRQQRASRDQRRGD